MVVIESFRNNSGSQKTSEARQVRANPAKGIGRGLAETLRSNVCFIRQVEVDFRATGFVGMQHAKRRRVDVNGNEIFGADVRISELVNVWHV